jgi:hypothetical protein
LLDADGDGVPDRISVRVVGALYDQKQVYNLPAGASYLGTYAGLSSATPANNAIDYLNMSGAAVYPDLGVTRSAIVTIDGIPKATSTIAYYEAAATAYEMRVTSGATEVLAWEPTLVVENAVAGIATLASTTPLATNWRGNDLTISVRKVGGSNILSGTTHYGAGLSLGQGTTLHASRGARRAYTNMAIQGIWQDPNDSWRYVYNNDPATATVQNLPNIPAYTGAPRLSLTGHPLKSGLSLTFCAPEWDGTNKRIIVEWDGGNITLANVRSGDSRISASIGTLNGKTSFTGVNNRISFLMTPINTLDAGKYEGNSLTASFNIDEGNPPTNLRIYVEGDNLSQRFTQSFIDFCKELGGPIRHMDGLQMNKHDNIVRHGVAWSQRSTRANIGLDSHPLGICLEDLAELSVLTSRPLWWNVTPAMAYSPAGIDYVEKSARLLWLGTESGTTARLSDIEQPVHLEIGNELWNMGTFTAPHWMAQQHMDAGWYPATVNHGGDPSKPFSTWMANMSERLWVHRRVSRAVGATIPANKLVRVFGVQHINPNGEQSAMQNPTQGLFPLPHEDCGWNGGAGIDMVAYAQYVGGDPLAGGPTGNIPATPDPAAVAVWLKDAFATSSIQTSSWNSFARANGFKVGQYEFGFSIGGINMTAAEEWTLRSTAEYKALLKEIYTSLSQFSEGPVCLFLDSSILISGTGHRWANFVFPGSPANKGWEAASEWWAEYVSEGGDT